MPPATEFELKFWALRYKLAYESLLSREPESSKKIILDPNKRETSGADKFAKSVILLAESEERIPAPEKAKS